MCDTGWSAICAKSVRWNRNLDFNMWPMLHTQLKNKILKIAFDNMLLYREVRAKDLFKPPEVDEKTHCH